MRLGPVLSLSTLIATVVLTGCSLNTAAGPSSQAGVSIRGKVHGGNQPLSGAHVYLMAANTTGYGQPSVSLLHSAATGHSDATGAYVLSDASGNFSITDDYSCATGQQVYLLATGGDSGSGPNSAAALMAVLGACPEGGSFAPTVPFIWANEATTVAGVYALAGFMTDATHVSSSGTTQANMGVANAFTTAANLADIASGSAFVTTPAGNGTVPQTTINTLANILAACVNSTGAASSGCTALFSNATADGTTDGTQPTETVTAALNIAHNATANVTNLYALQAGVATPFQPSLGTAPYNYAVILSFTGGGLFYPDRVAIDSSGNVWTANVLYNTTSGKGASLSKFAGATGAALSPELTGFTGSGIGASSTLAQPYALAIDAADKVWTGNTGGSTGEASLSKFDNSGTPLSSTGYDLGYVGFADSLAVDKNGNAIVSVGLYNKLAVKVDGTTGAVTTVSPAFSPQVIRAVVAIDPSNHIWVPEYDSGLQEMDATGTSILYQTNAGGGLLYPTAAAIDHSGNIWIADGGSVSTSHGTSSANNVAEFNSSGVPLSPSPPFGTGGYNVAFNPIGIAIDGDSAPWVLNGILTASSGPTSVAKLSASGTLLGNFYSTLTNKAAALAIDPSGNIWVPNLQGNAASILEYVGIATPVVTPIAAGVANNTLGARP